MNRDYLAAVADERPAAATGGGHDVVNQVDWGDITDESVQDQRLDQTATPQLGDENPLIITGLSQDLSALRLGHPEKQITRTRGVADVRHVFALGHGRARGGERKSR